MPNLYPEIEPFAHGMLEVTGGDLVYCEACGNPTGKSAVVLHGGPGSGCTPWHRRLFNPNDYRVVLFDQRGCGRSRPHASSPETELSGNTTGNLIADIELLRAHLDVERWLVLGGSWGSALALAYAERFPTRVTELILFGVGTGRREEFDWLFRDGLGAFFPEEWKRRRSALPVADRDGDIVEAYCHLLQDPDPATRERAALAWCLWESATPDWPPMSGLAPRFRDPSYAMASARLVTHYVRHDAWLGDGRILRDVDRLAGFWGARERAFRFSGAARGGVEPTPPMASLGVGGCERCWTCGQQSRHHGGVDPGYGPFRERMTFATLVAAEAYVRLQR